MTTLSKIVLEIDIGKYITHIEEQLKVIAQQEGGQQAVARLRELLFES